jgi:hypothetical protein
MFKQVCRSPWSTEPIQQRACLLSRWPRCNGRLPCTDGVGSRCVATDMIAKIMEVRGCCWLMNGYWHISALIRLGFGLLLHLVQDGVDADGQCGE